VLPLLLVALPYGFCLAGLRLHIGASWPNGLDGWMQARSPGKAPDRFRYGALALRLCDGLFLLTERRKPVRTKESASAETSPGRVAGSA
jgi:hypothetical protein